MIASQSVLIGLKDFNLLKKENLNFYLKKKINVFDKIKTHLLKPKSVNKFNLFIF